jgi:hypothetical protein
VAALGTVALVWLAGGPPAAGDERPRASSQVQAPAQGGGGVEPVSGTPPAVAPSLEAKPAAATIQAGPRLARRASGRSMRRLAVEEGEATLDVDGVREVLRPGTRLGADTVRSVSPERIVLEREAKPGEAGGPALVILTFDEAGRGTERVFWTADPGAPRPAEAKRP